jgi:hypothetical protein
MLAAYSNGEQLIGRHIIEEVADNLDMLPSQDILRAAEASIDGPNGRVLRSDARNEMWDGMAKAEQIKPRVFDDANGNGYSNGNGNGNGHAKVNGNGQNVAKPQPEETNFFDSTDGDILLEIDDFKGKFKKF